MQAKCNFCRHSWEWNWRGHGAIEKWNLPIPEKKAQPGFGSKPDVSGYPEERRSKWDGTEGGESWEGAEAELGYTTSIFIDFCQLLSFLVEDSNRTILPPPPHANAFSFLALC